MAIKLFVQVLTFTVMNAACVTSLGFLPVLSAFLFPNNTSQLSLKCGAFHKFRPAYMKSSQSLKVAFVMAVVLELLIEFCSYSPPPKLYVITYTFYLLQDSSS